MPTNPTTPPPPPAPASHAGSPSPGAQAGAPAPHDAPAQQAALVASAPAYRRVFGDMVCRFYNLSGNNGDTFTLPGVGQIFQVDPVPTTAINVGATFVGNTITFLSAGAWAATVQVISRYG